MDDIAAGREVDADTVAALLSLIFAARTAVADLA
jgi:hypothetical protein